MKEDTLYIYFKHKGRKFVLHFPIDNVMVTKGKKGIEEAARAHKRLVKEVEKEREEAAKKQLKDEAKKENGE